MTAERMLSETEAGAAERLEPNDRELFERVLHRREVLSLLFSSEKEKDAELEELRLQNDKLRQQGGHSLASWDSAQNGNAQDVSTVPSDRMCVCLVLFTTLVALP